MAEPEEEKEEVSQEVKDLKNDINTFAEVEALGDSEGGKILIKGLLSDIVGVVEAISARYPTLTLQEFVGFGSDLKNKLDLVRSVTRAKKHKEELQKILEEAFKE